MKTFMVVSVTHTCVTEQEAIEVKDGLGDARSLIIPSLTFPIFGQVSPKNVVEMLSETAYENTPKKNVRLPRGTAHSTTANGIPRLASDVPITELNLTSHIRRMLRQAKIFTVGELARRTERYLRNNGLGRESINKIRAALRREGLAMAGTPANELETFGDNGTTPPDDTFTENCEPAVAAAH